jgi:hypothetical protein
MSASVQIGIEFALAFFLALQQGMFGRSYRWTVTAVPLAKRVP